MSSEKSLKQKSVNVFQERLINAFGGKSVKEIADLLHENYNSFWNWASGRSEMPHKVLAKIATHDVSLNYLLTGTGEPNISHFKDFDVGRSVDTNEDWLNVIQEWYEFEGDKMPDTTGASFMGGWGSFDREKKIAAIKDFKAFLDRIKDD